MNKFQELEVELFIEALYRAYGYDFRDYSKVHMKRRIAKHVEEEQLGSISALQDKLLNDEGYFEEVIKDFSINVTSFFRDPPFFRTFRKEIVPYLKSFPKIKIWHAGCSTGEEVYSMAMLLHEEGLLDRCHLYGTDFNGGVLEIAEKGVYDLEQLETFMINYKETGGCKNVSDYFELSDTQMTCLPFIKRNMSFHQHNLVGDQDLGEMTIVICRNVLIYFNPMLKEKVLSLLDNSLKKGGVLCLGKQETLQKSIVRTSYSTTYESDKIYTKKII